MRRCISAALVVGDAVDSLNGRACATLGAIVDDGDHVRIIIFGATGMIGHGVLDEALDSDTVSAVVTVGRRRVAVEHPKLTNIVHDDFGAFETLAERLRGFDACFWCLGTSALGLDEAAYTKVTHDTTLAAAEVLHRESPGLKFLFLSSTGADVSEQGRTMWTRVKGKTENALRRVGFAELVVFRPAFVRAMRGAQVRGRLHRTLYPVVSSLGPLWRLVGKGTSNVEVGRAMLAVAAGAASKPVLDSSDINVLAAVLGRRDS